MITWPRITVDRRRAAQALTDALTLLLAMLPFLLGFIVGLLLRLGWLLWMAFLWVLAAVLAGYDLGRGKRQ